MVLLVHCQMVKYFKDYGMDKETFIKKCKDLAFDKAIYGKNVKGAWLSDVYDVGSYQLYLSQLEGIEADTRQLNKFESDPEAKEFFRMRIYED